MTDSFYSSMLYLLCREVIGKYRAALEQAVADKEAAQNQAAAAASAGNNGNNNNASAPASGATDFDKIKAVSRDAELPAVFLRLSFTEFFGKAVASAA